MWFHFCSMIIQVMMSKNKVTNIQTPNLVLPVPLRFTAFSYVDRPKRWTSFRHSSLNHVMYLWCLKGICVLLALRLLHSSIACELSPSLLQGLSDFFSNDNKREGTSFHHLTVTISSDIAALRELYRCCALSRRSLKSYIEHTSRRLFPPVTSSKALHTYF